MIAAHFLLSDNCFLDLDLCVSSRKILQNLAALFMFIRCLKMKVNFNNEILSNCGNAHEVSVRKIITRLLRARFRKTVCLDK